MHLVLTDNECHYLCSWDPFQRRMAISVLNQQLLQGILPQDGVYFQRNNLFSLLSMLLSDSCFENRKVAPSIINNSTY